MVFDVNNDRQIMCEVFSGWSMSKLWVFPLSWNLCMRTVEKEPGACHSVWDEPFMAYELIQEIEV